MKKIIPFILVFILTGCISTVESLMQVKKEIPLTEEDVARGLKEALERGAKFAIKSLSKKDGYFGDPLLRLALPDEADSIVDNIGKIPGGQALLDDLILSINRSAEQAASKALPIFVKAIDDMSISEAFKILNGQDDEATRYFKSKTYGPLMGLYQPELEKALDQKIVGDVSANEIWNTLTPLYNELAGSVVGKVKGLKRININLSEYLTKKALDGVFWKIAEEEKGIRKDPAKRATALLKKVFGSID